MMSDDFVRRNSADQDKRLDADKVQVGGLDVHRLRVAHPPLMVLVDQSNPLEIYIGEAAPGSLPSAPVWRIKKLLTVGPQKGIVFANGSADYTNIWEERHLLIYPEPL
jgi:hypothetical protein